MPLASGPFFFTGNPTSEGFVPSLVQLDEANGADRHAELCGDLRLRLPVLELAPDLAHSIKGELACGREPRSPVVPHVVLLCPHAQVLRVDAGRLVAGVVGLLVVLQVAPEPDAEHEAGQEHRAVVEEDDAVPADPRAAGAA